MSTEITTTKGPVNPFARAQSEHISHGAVAIESERAIAEAQGKLVIAKRFPRDQARAYANIVEACQRQLLAEEAMYSFPRGGQTVSGPSIRLAEMLAANWGNIDYGIRELARKEGVSEMEAYAWDLETNVVSSQKFTVRHIRDTKMGPVVLKDERDIYELTANLGGRRLRARILAVIPADIVQAAVNQCTKTLEGGSELPLADRVRNMVTAFRSLGITPAMIEKRLAHTLEATTPEELADLRKIHNSLRDGISKRDDWFGDNAGGDDDGTPGRPPPPERKKKGAALVKEEAVAPVAADSHPDLEAAVPVATPPTPDEKPAVAPAIKPDEPKVESFAQAAAATPVTALTANQKLIADVEVAEVGAISAKFEGKDVLMATARVTGEFEGQVWHVGGAAGTPPVASKPWAVGAKLRLRLIGYQGAKGVRAMVESVETVEGF